MKLLFISILLIFLLNKSDIQIQIKDTDGKLTDAKLEFYQNDVKIIEYETNGYFRAQNFPYGTYKLVITKCERRKPLFMDFKVWKASHFKVIIVDKCEPQ